MKLAFTFVNATIDKIIKTLFHNAQFELWDCEIYIYLDIPTSNYFNVKLAWLIEKLSISSTDVSVLTGSLRTNN